MSRTLQIIELMLNAMEKEPDRYRLEIASRGICISDHKELDEGKKEIPTYYTFFHKPLVEYQYECNKMFDEFIGGLKG